MKPVPSASGEPVNWLNYHTGIRGIYFRLDANRGGATASIEVTGSDEETRIQRFRKISALLAANHPGSSSGWVFEERAIDEHGRPFARIFREIPRLDFTKETDWPALITFFKESMLLLDDFWQINKDFFE